MIISILIFLCLLLSIFSSIVLLIIGLYQYIIAFIGLFMIFILLFRMWFYHRCRIYIHSNRNIINIDRFIRQDENNYGYITFISDKKIYMCKNENENINFDLHNFIFKRSFIRAFVIRQVRYKTISNRLKISKLFSIRLKVKCKYDRLYLVVDNKKYLIYTNGISKNSVISSEISKANFGAMYSSTRTFVSGNSVMNINEKLYLDYYKFYKERRQSLNK